MGLLQTILDFLHPVESALRRWLADPWALWLLALLPALAALAVLARRWRRRRLARLGRLAALGTLARGRRPWRLLRGLCLTVALLVSIGAIAGPRWGLDPQQSVAPGRDVVVLVDVSRSMLA